MGATGSYESLYDSVGLHQKVVCLCNGFKINYDYQIAHYYDFIVDRHCQDWKNIGRGLWDFFRRKMKYVCGNIRKLAAVLMRQPRREVIAKLKMKFRMKLKMKLVRIRFIFSSMNREGHAGRWAFLDREFEKMWKSQVSPKGNFAILLNFPKFPNPHIRSNGFMIDRRRFLSLKGLDIKTKLEACSFESGAESMTRQILRQGMSAIVVGRSGQRFDVGDWSRSGTFRLGNQSNLLLADNQCRQFDRMTPGTKATHARMTWGDYETLAPEDFPDLGFKFSINQSVVGGAIESSERQSVLQTKLSNRVARLQSLEMSIGGAASASLMGKSLFRKEYDELLSSAYAEARRPYLETIAPIPADAFHKLSWRYNVEINSGCNLRCTMCIRGDSKGYEQTSGFMDQRFFERVLDKIKRENNKADVCLYGNSEPFLHPQLSLCVAAVKQRGLNCMISTNLNVIHNLKEVLEAKPDELMISVSGFSQEVYGRAHRGGDIELVKTNMRTLARMRADLGSTVPIQVHYHLYRDNWGDEFEQMKTFATGLGFSYIFSWARSISMEKTIQYLRLRELQTCGSVPPLQVSDAGFGPQRDWVSLFPEVTEDFSNNVKRLGIAPDEASALYQHYPEPIVCPVGDLFTSIRHDGSVGLCCCFSDNRLTVASNFLEVTQEELSRRRRWHPLCRECLRYKMHMYFHVLDMPMWDRIMAEKFPNIPPGRRRF